MNKGVSFAAVALAATIAPLAACANQQGGQATTSPSSSAPPGTERMTTQLKSADGNQVGTATIDFANGYATVTVEAGPNQVLSPGFHGLQIHSVGKCEANSAAPAGGSTGDFNSAGSVYQAPESHRFSGQRRPDRIAGAQRRLGETRHHHQPVHRLGPAKQLGHRAGHPPDRGQLER